MSGPVNVVVGAGGATGFEAVQFLLKEPGTVRAVVRNPDKYKDKFPKSSSLEVVKADVTDAASLESVLKGASGVIFAASGSGYFSAKEVDCEVRALESGPV